MKVTSHVSRYTRRTGDSAIDGGITRDRGYALSQRQHKWIEQCFGWGGQKNRLDPTGDGAGFSPIGSVTDTDDGAP